MAGKTDDPFAPTDGIPHSIIVGRFKAWRLNYRYPVECVIRRGDVSVTIAPNADGVFEATSAVTATLAQGENQFDVVAVRDTDGERVIVETTTVDCFPSTDQFHSHARTMVRKIESILEGRADADVSSYSIKQRSITKMGVDELTKWRDYYLAEVGRERDPLTGKRRKNNKLTVGFR